MKINDFDAQKYISLATYKKDGTRVATPVWMARDGDYLYVITEAASGKAKRLRNSSRAQIAVCDMRGNVSGDVVDVTAELLDETGTDHVKALIDSKYGMTARLINLRGSVNKLLRREQPQRVGIRIGPA